MRRGSPPVPARPPRVIDSRTRRRLVAAAGTVVALTLTAGCTLVPGSPAPDDGRGGEPTAAYRPTPSPPPTTEPAVEARHAASDLVNQRLAALGATNRATWLATVTDPGAGFGADQAGAVRPDDVAADRQAGPAQRRRRATTGGAGDRRARVVGRAHPPDLRLHRVRRRPARLHRLVRPQAHPRRVAVHRGGRRPERRAAVRPARPGRGPLTRDARDRRRARGDPARIPDVGRRRPRPDREGLGRGAAGGHRRAELAGRAQDAAGSGTGPGLRPDRGRHGRAAAARHPCAERPGLSQPGRVHRV